MSVFSNKPLITWPSIEVKGLITVKENQSETVVKVVPMGFIQELLQRGEREAQYRTGLNSKYSMDKRGFIARKQVRGWACPSMENY